MKLPQLSLRELFWLVLVCALALGWWLERRKALDIDRRREESEWLLTESREANKRLAEYTSVLEQHAASTGYVVRRKTTGELWVDKAAKATP